MATALPLKSHSDKEILNEPYAVALLDMNYKPEVILLAVSKLRNRKAHVAANTLLTEIMEMESTGRMDVSPRETVKRPGAGCDRYGSDGESGEESLETNYAPSSVTPNNDLQEDGEAPLMPVLDKIEHFDVRIQEPPVKKGREGRKGNPEIRRKLHTLREENRRLKERHLCRSCHENPISITFLPCGHYSFCFECGQSFDSCPICRKTILADVRTFLA